MTSNSAVGAYSYPLPGSPRPHAVTAAGAWSYTYDANGNMETGAGRTFTYNGENRPTAIDTQTYVYGPDGERWKTVDTALGTETLYLGNDYEIASGVVTKYLPGNAKRVGSPGEPVVETFWLHRDHQGSIQTITDATGTEVQRFRYYPYGDRLATATAHTETKGWIGERQDSTGLFYLHARYYDPVIGRFASADPSDPLAPGVGLNRYAYAGNSPVMRVDPWGLEFGTNEDRGYGMAEDAGTSSGNDRVQRPSGATQVRDRDGNVIWGANWNYEIKFGRLDGRIRLTDGQLVTKDQLIALKSGVPGGLIQLASASEDPWWSFFGRYAGKIAGAFSVWDYCTSSPYCNRSAILNPNVIWGMEPKERGIWIERYLAETEYADWGYVGKLDGGFFESIDFVDHNNTTALSVRTTNTGAGNWRSDLQSHLRVLSSRRPNLSGQPAQRVVLDIRVPPGRRHVAEPLIGYGQQLPNPVDVIISEFP